MANRGSSDTANIGVLAELSAPEAERALSVREPARDVFVSLTRVSTSDQPIENATIVAEEMLRWLREIEGFHGLLMLSREGTTLGLTFWESREVAELHRPVRMQFLERMTTAADVQIEEILDYDVTFAHVGPLMSDVTR